MLEKPLFKKKIKIKNREIWNLSNKLQYFYCTMKNTVKVSWQYFYLLGNKEPRLFTKYLILPVAKTILVS